MSLEARLVAAFQIIGTDIKGLAQSKQDKLVPGTNLKTVNGQSLLGGGNITISGEGGGTGVSLDQIHASALYF